jgi:hypothetical protein
VGERRNTYKTSVGKPEEKRPIERFDDNIKMDLS